jgi:hypothetical protein
MSRATATVDYKDEAHCREMVYATGGAYNHTWFAYE